MAYLSTNRPSTIGRLAESLNPNVTFACCCAAFCVMEFVRPYFACKASLEFCIDPLPTLIHALLGASLAPFVRSVLGQRTELLCIVALCSELFSAQRRLW